MTCRSGSDNSPVRSAMALAAGAPIPNAAAASRLTAGSIAFRALVRAGTAVAASAPRASRAFAALAHVGLGVGEGRNEQIDKLDGELRQCGRRAVPPACGPLRANHRVQLSTRVRGRRYLRRAPRAKIACAANCGFGVGSGLDERGSPLALGLRSEVSERLGGGRAHNGNSSSSQAPIARRRPSAATPNPRAHAPPRLARADRTTTANLEAALQRRPNTGKCLASRSRGDRAIACRVKQGRNRHRANPSDRVRHRGIIGGLPPQGINEGRHGREARVQCPKRERRGTPGCFVIAVQQCDQRRHDVDSAEPSFNRATTPASRTLGSLSVRARTMTGTSSFRSSVDAAGAVTAPARTSGERS